MNDQIQNATILDELRATELADIRLRLEARRSIALRLALLGFVQDSIRLPLSEDKNIAIEIQSTYRDHLHRAMGDFEGYFKLEVFTWVNHKHDEGCEFSCEREVEYRSLRPASPEEVVAALAAELKRRIQLTEGEIRELKGLQEALPNKEDVDKLRRRVEDVLRKQGAKTVLKVARLLDILGAS